MSDLLPSKVLPLGHSIVGRGALILSLLEGTARPAAQLYVLCKERHTGLTYEEFGEALTMLYAAGAVRVTDGVVDRG